MWQQSSKDHKLSDCNRPKQGKNRATVAPGSAKPVDAAVKSQRKGQSKGEGPESMNSVGVRSVHLQVVQIVLSTMHFWTKQASCCRTSVSLLCGGL